MDVLSLHKPAPFCLTHLTLSSEHYHIHTICVDQRKKILLKLVCTANQTQNCSGTMSLTDCAVFNFTTDEHVVLRHYNSHKNV